MRLVHLRANPRPSQLFLWHDDWGCSPYRKFRYRDLTFDSKVRGQPRLDSGFYKCRSYLVLLLLSDFILLAFTFT